MLGLFRKSGNFSILAQFILLSSFLAITGNFNWHFAPYLITGFTAGITAFRSRSLIYSFAASWISIIIIDAFVIWTAK
jgi:branched-subunit amino acid transport protein